MECSKCGASLLPDAKFCGKCGSDALVRAGEDDDASAGASEASAETVVPPAVPPRDEPPGAADTPEQPLAAPDPGDAPAPSTVVIGGRGGPRCVTCGASLLPNAKFCAKCGTVAAQAQGPAAPRVAGQPPQHPTAPTPPMPGPQQQYGPQPGYGPQQYGPGPQGPYYRPVTPARDWVGEGIAYVTRIFKFDQSVYRDLRADSAATPISLAALVLAMFFFGLGGYLWFTIEYEGDWEVFWKSVLVGGLIALGLWLGGVMAAAGVLTYMFRKTFRFDEVLRVCGAASAVLALGFFMFIPGVAFGIALVAVCLWIVVVTFALQSAFDLEPREAVTAGLALFAVWAVFMPLIVTANNPLGPGIFLFDAVNDGFKDLYDLATGYRNLFGE